VGDYRRLDVWNRAHRLVLAVYRAAGFPDQEQYGLVSQMRRAAFSIPMNIAEGCGRNGDSELRRSLRIALGSAAELEYQVSLSQELEYLHSEAAHQLAEEVDHVKRVLARLCHRIASPATSRRTVGSNGTPVAKRGSGQRHADSG
jgi:four helix bundle protein